MPHDPAANARRVLIVDDDLEFATHLSAGLRQHGYETALATTSNAMAASAAAEFRPGIMICDVACLGTVSETPQAAAPAAVSHIGMARNADMQTAIKAMRHGAVDFFDKNCRVSEVAAILDRCFDKRERLKWDEGGIEVLRRAKEAAEEASRTKSEFLATVSHELRTPLNAIIGFSELMIRGILGPLGNPQYRAYLDDIHQSGCHLLDIINDILDFSKAEAGKLELNESEVDVHQVVTALLRLKGPRARDASLELIDALPPDLPPLWCDARKLKQMLLNLLTNAVKFTPSGGKIEVQAHCGKAGMTISVRDSGIGISDTDLARVLEPFVQGDNKLSRTHEGTGLGLTLVNAMIKIHGGSFRLESRIGHGTTASLNFPPERIGHHLSSELKDLATG
jgi:signal transduction histidine kinase